MTRKAFIASLLAAPAALLGIGTPIKKDPVIYTLKMALDEASLAADQLAESLRKLATRH